MISNLLTSPGRAWSWLSTTRRTAGERRSARPRRQMVIAQGAGRAMVLDCQRHQRMVDRRGAGSRRLARRASSMSAPSCADPNDEALSDAEHDAQRLALMFAQ